MAETRPLPDPVEDGWKLPGWLTALIAVAVIVCIVLAFVVPPSAPEPGAADEASQSDRAVGAVRDIESAMEAYAAAHGGRFPTGKSSTEVFQKLLDEHFLKDPRILFLEMNGKTAATTGILTANNVAYDVTTPVDLATPGGVPVVFSTGYRIEYKSDGVATPRPAAIRPDICREGILVAYPHAQTTFKARLKADKAMTLKVILPGTTIDPGTYTQLTPDGPLPSP